MHWTYLIHEFHNLSWITEISELFHDILIYWDAHMILGSFNVVADQCIFIYCLSSLPTERISSTVCIRTAHGGDSDCPLCHNSCILLQGDSLLLSQISCGKQCSFHISVDAGERYEWCTLLCTVLDCKLFLSFSASHRYEATHGCTMKVRGCASKKTNKTQS